MTIFINSKKSFYLIFIINNDKSVCVNYNLREIENFKLLVDHTIISQIQLITNQRKNA